tara:strand:- start:252 stop:899 length:648 start_codon:yes stop_codon:yes gene_type:complete
MPYLWPAFTAALTPWFVFEMKNALSTNGEAPTSQKSALDGSSGAITAEVITAEYQLAMKLATVVPYSNPILPGGLNGWKKKPFLNGFQAGFNLQASTPQSLGMAPYAIMAAGVIASWAGGVKFAPAPPHPPGLAPNPAFIGANMVCVSVFPGSPMPLAAMLQIAFTCGSKEGIAPLLVSAFMAHLSTVSGVYQPLVVGPTPTPIPGPPIPWVGVM